MELPGKAGSGPSSFATIDRRQRWCITFILLLALGAQGCANRVNDEDTSRTPDGNLGQARQAYDSGDYATAVAILKPLADGGDSDAAYLLADSYDYGRGVDQDYSKAFSYYYLAANRGHAEAQYQLAERYYGGVGVERSYFESLVWYKIALKNKDLSSRSRNSANSYVNIILSKFLIDHENGETIWTEAIRRADKWEPMRQNADQRQMLYDFVLAKVREYEDLPEPKALIACIAWNRKSAPQEAIRNLFATYSSPSSDRPIFLTQLSNDALGRCNKWRKAQNANCECQVLDQNGTNVL